MFKKTTPLLVIMLLFNTFFAMQKANIITLVSSEGKEFSLPQTTAMLSQTIKHMLSETQTPHPVLPFSNISTKNLASLITHLHSIEALPRKKMANMT